MITFLEAHVLASFQESVSYIKQSMGGGIK